MQDQVITIQPSTQGGFEVCWCDNAMLQTTGPLMRIFDHLSSAVDHANMVAEQAYFENGEFWTINNIAA
jgi:hypothetical protein